MKGATSRGGSRSRPRVPGRAVPPVPSRGLPRFSSVLSSRRVKKSGCGGLTARGGFVRGRAAVLGGATEPRGQHPRTWPGGVSGAVGQAFSKRCGESGNERRQETVWLVRTELTFFAKCLNWNLNGAGNQRYAVLECHSPWGAERSGTRGSPPKRGQLQPRPPSVPASLRPEEAEQSSHKLWQTGHCGDLCPQSLSLASEGVLSPPGRASLPLRGEG